MAIQISKTVPTMNALKKRLDKGKTYFVRFGDNDIYQMMGIGEYGETLRKPQGGNRTIWSKQLQRNIKASFSIRHDLYMKAVTHHWPLEPGMHGTKFDSYKSKYLDDYLRELTIEKKFWNPVIFHWYAVRYLNEWNQFLNDYIVPKSKVYVGHHHPSTQKPFGEFKYHVHTLEKNAPQESDQVWKRLKSKLDVDMVILACGQLSRVLAGKLWAHGYNGQVLDIGSIVDVYAGQNTRGWTRVYGENIRKGINSI